MTTQDERERLKQLQCLVKTHLGPTWLEVLDRNTRAEPAVQGGELAGRYVAVPNDDPDSEWSLLDKTRPKGHEEIATLDCGEATMNQIVAALSTPGDRVSISREEGKKLHQLIENCRFIESGTDEYLRKIRDSAVELMPVQKALN